MRRFSDVPIARKLTLVILLTCTVTLVLAGAVLITSELFTFRHTLAQDLDVLAGILGEHSTAALSFGNEGDAEKTLASLQNEPHIVAARLYTPEGAPLASYARPDATPEFPAAPG